MAKYDKKVAREHLKTKNTIDKLCAAALTQFLEAIGRKDAQSPKQAIRESLFNLGSASLEEMLTINRTLELMLANAQFAKGE